MERIILGMAAALAFVIPLDAAAAPEREKSAGARIDAAVLYHNYCSVCHGDKGDGNSRAKNSLVPPPANFTDVRVQGRLTRAYIAAIIRDGKPGTAMVGWKTQLSPAEIGAVAGFVRRSFVEPAGDVALLRGRSIYGHFCVSCHGVDGRGTAPQAASGAIPVRDLTTARARRDLTRDRLIAAVAVGRKGTAMEGFSGRLSPSDLEAVVDYVRKTVMAGGGAGISGISAHGGRARDTPSAPVK